MITAFDNKVLTLFHGSHGGIVGSINAQSSRDLCDFGKGFYLGEMEEQAKTIAASEKGGIIYTIRVDINDMKVYRFTDDVLWALYVGVNRGRINTNKYPKLRDIVARINKYDVVVGLIADDRMAFIYSEFINGNITDKALVECLKYVKLGHQYVFKNNEACSKLCIISERHLSAEECKILNHDKSVTIGGIPIIVEDLKRKFRRDGRFVDEVLEEYL